MTRAAKAIKINGFCKNPNESITTLSSPDGTVSPIKVKPIIARKSPIPAPIPSFKLFGIALIIQARIGVTEIITNRIPATKTAPNASCGVCPKAPQTKNATYAFKPIPQDKPIGHVLP